MEGLAVIVGVFCRPNHPAGYGMPQHEGEPGRRAHGYITALVRCADMDELDLVRKRLASKGLEEPFGHTYQWYGGLMDLVSAIDCGDDTEIALFTGNNVVVEGRTMVSIGDNRYVGLYEAEAVLAE